jgi:hypothetical protein
MSNKNVNSKNKLFVLVAIALIMCMGSLVFVSSGLTANSSTQTQPIDNQMQTSPSPTQDADDSAPSLMTEQEALAIATPIILNYAREHNRTITTQGIRVSFNLNTEDTYGSRGDISESDLIQQGVLPPKLFEEQPKINYSTYPAWHVGVYFDMMNQTRFTDDGKMDPENFNIGYKISIWADTREIYLSTSLDVFC